MLNDVQATFSEHRHFSPQPVLELRGVSKSYGTVKALTDLNLSIPRGQVLALLGPNGAGKTTAISLMLGLSRPDNGVAEMFGAAPDTISNRLRTGAVMQLSGIPETLTVREHLQGFAACYSRPLPLSRVVAATGLDGLERRQYRQLSGGQRQRLHLALALVGDPEVLFLDEPTTGLDVETRRSLWQLVREFSATGRTVLLTTHYLEEADALADRIVLLNRGRIVADGTPEQIRSVAAGRRIRARTTVSAAAAARLDGVLSASRSGDWLELTVQRAEDVTRELLSADSGLADLEIGTLSLDEAFMNLTAGETN